ncbi:hypothetical protein SSX86_021283 [Deinandra increscens subsp. villosa]|uniref:Uncharacterized protein n=1 Tax=Deinandra increscens subsp. villosa TaxID=3103831 RepID=A0AAP0CUP6_9ASTR
MDFHLQQIVLILAMIISNKHASTAQYVPPSSTTVVAPVAKHTDSANPVYSVQVLTAYVNQQFIHTKFLIDIEAPFTWYECVVMWNTYPGPNGGCPDDKICVAPVSCEEYQCTDVRTSTFDQRASCPPVNNGSTLPGWWTCSCPVSAVNPIDGSCVEPLLNYDELRFHLTDGRTDFPDFTGIYPNSACAPSSAFNSFPKNVTGVLALSASSHALPAYFFYSYEKSFALCLPNTVSSLGALFLGRGPYYFRSSHSDIDVRTLLSRTPLLNRQGRFGYFIGVDTIVIKSRSIGVPENATTKISTTMPYTTLRTDIYKQVVRRFSMVTKRLDRAKAVVPFDLCYKVFAEARLKVPDIDFELRGGEKWTISTANSMRRVTKDVACLAFVDGGATSEDAIVMGTFQMEDNFMLFDLVNSTLGFSSSLLSKGTSCASFNFTESQNYGKRRTTEAKSEAKIAIENPIVVYILDQEQKFLKLANSKLQVKYPSFVAMDQFDDLSKERAAALLRAVYATKYVKDDNVPSQIEEGLYLGSVGAANNKTLLKSLNITHILTVSGSIPPSYPNDFTYKVVAVHDKSDVNIAQFFDDCFDFINEAKKTGGVLVHCLAGVSRSVTIVVAYLMKKHGMSSSEALKLAKSKRRVAAPNSGFMLQLKGYEKTASKDTLSIKVPHDQ